MRVHCVGQTPMANMEMAGRVCNRSVDQWSHGDQYHSIPGDVKIRNSADFLERNAIGRGHAMIFEHGVLQFHIRGISRALLQELATHRVGISRVASSTRWSLKKSDGIALPPQIPEELLEEYVAHQQLCLERAREIAEKHGNDVGKYWLADGYATDALITVNVRELRHIIALRARPDVLPEFRKLCRMLLDAVPEDYAACVEDLRAAMCHD